MTRRSGASVEDIETNYTLAAVRDRDGTTLLHRSNLTTELHIVKAVFLGREYERRGLRLEPEDVVLDLGANIGAFTASVAPRVRRVIAVEPEDVNFSFLRRNVYVNHLGNVELVQAAAVGDDDRTRMLYLGSAPYYYSLKALRGRRPVEVNCVNVNAILETWEPTKLKVDIEGAELEVLTAIEDYGPAEQLAFEYNFDMNGDLRDGYEHWDRLVAHLERTGWEVGSLESIPRNKSWNRVFCIDRRSRP